MTKTEDRTWGKTERILNEDEHRRPKKCFVCKVTYSVEYYPGGCPFQSWEHSFHASQQLLAKLSYDLMVRRHDFTERLINQLEWAKPGEIVYVTPMRKNDRPK